MPLTPTLSPLRSAPLRFAGRGSAPSARHRCAANKNENALVGSLPCADAASKHEIFILEAEHHAAPAAADMFVLVGDMLTAGHEVVENFSEGKIIRQTSGHRRLEDARGKQRATLRHLGRLEFVAQPLLERRHLGGA